MSIFFYMRVQARGGARVRVRKYEYAEKERVPAGGVRLTFGHRGDFQEVPAGSVGICENTSLLMLCYYSLWYLKS